MSFASNSCSNEAGTIFRIEPNLIKAIALVESNLKKDSIGTVSYTHLDVYKRQGISFGSDAGMDRPARGDHRLLVMHHNVTRFLRLPHHVENAGVIIHIEIEINFHPALVGVTPVAYTHL